MRTRRFDGVYRWLESRVYPLRDAHGQIVRWYNLIIDIDDRKRAEEAAAASERDLTLIIDTIPSLAWSARPDGSADFFNQHYLDFTGLTAEEAGGWGWTAAVHPDDLNGLAGTWQRIIASKAPGEAEARLRRSDGTIVGFCFAQTHCAIRLARSSSGTGSTPTSRTGNKRRPSSGERTTASPMPSD